MSVLALASAQAPQRQRKIVIAHFDAHGVSTGAVLCRRIGCNTIISRFPDTGPQRFAAFAKTLDVYGAEVHIVDIPINVAAPKEHIEALATLAQQASSLVLWDHHETNLRYLGDLPPSINVRFFGSAVDMALAILGGDTGSEDAELALVGVVADRDPSILRLVDRETVERRLMPLANTLDVLVRRDVQQTAIALVQEGVGYIRSNIVDYPPYKLVGLLEARRRGARAHLLAPVDTVQQQQLESWLPKTLEQYALRHGIDYVVIPTRQLDRRTNEPFWSVRVIKYWLSDRPSPAELLRGLPDVQGRQIVGHADYISIRCTDQADAVALAETVFEQLEAPVSQAAHLINEQYVARAIQSDFARILQLLERIARALERGAEAKERQVGLLERLYEREERTRYD